jgi:hypothetical protein
MDHLYLSDLQNKAYILHLKLLHSKNILRNISKLKTAKYLDFHLILQNNYKNS